MQQLFNDSHAFSQADPAHLQPLGLCQVHQLLLDTSEVPRCWQGPEPRAARSPTAAEVATSSTPAASITSQAAGSSKGRKQDLQHGR